MLDMKNFSALGRCVAALLLLAPPLVTRAQNVGIGITTPTQTLDVNGNVRVRGTTGTGTRLLQADATGIVSPAATSYPATGTFAPTLASTTTGLNNPLVAVSGTLAVVLNRGAGTLSLYDVTNPAALVLRGTATGISGGVKVAMNGASAAVLCSGSPYVVQLYTLGGGAPTLATTLTPPNSLVNSFAGIAMTATRLYAAFDRGGSYGYFYVYDVSNPAAVVSYNQAVPCTTCSTGNTGYFTPQNVAAAGTPGCREQCLRRRHRARCERPHHPPHRRQHRRAGLQRGRPAHCPYHECAVHAHHSHGPAFYV